MTALLVALAVIAILGELLRREIRDHRAFVRWVTGEAEDARPERGESR